MRMLSCLLLLVWFGACGPKTAPTVVLPGPVLAPCPETPNCVSSMADPADSQHTIEPFAWQPGDPDAAAIAAWVGERRRCEVIAQDTTWVHATCTTALLRFVDDVAFVVDEDDGAVQVRSASRVGRSDLGKNRSRVEELRVEWEALRTGAR